jgi:hypothetical protein
MKTPYSTLLYFILMFSMGCSLDEDVIESYHVRKSILNTWLDDRPGYAFKDVPPGAGFVTSFPWNAVRSKVPENILNSTDIQYYIYSSVDDAEFAMVEHLGMSNLYMHNIIDTPLPNGPIGDNCWHQLLVGSIQFLRNNVFVSVAPLSNNSFTDFSIVENLARKIDMSIVESKKVYNASLIPVPNVLSLETISSLPDDWGQSVEVNVNAVDPNSRKLTFRQVGAGLATTNDNGSFNISPENSVPVYVSEDPGKFRIMIWVWNEEHLVALAEKEFSFQK